ncbi:SbcC/MukB-like Walker B domain-containing protein [Nocardia ignorata]|uniref:Putative exonuclease SbcCD C subunit n=1 Tax=Nocardia ignorata TaxID=145285 RepID=A0A4R6PR98_NOCIG|nr:SbcC/MukB-like Walker B domain-containing protein [Nocardia ignorata]TDP41104.1 putative exonuclease SbcCD C subunit [Nocardia ignorata]
MTLIHGGVRFVPTRAGIVNLWDYRDQEFCFADGRLVLRGPNGSGKTKALEVLFPFVLDGRIEPRRLNPFAGEERTMKSNLLYRKQESAYSYVWMEFARGSWEDPEVVTVGIGMRATRSSDKVTRWYFVADGRAGVDFSLIGPDDRPLTRKQLAEQIGSDAIVDRPVEYRAAIDARMFGLGMQRYDQLINLILTLRRPQLAKNLDPRGLSQALTDGLRPLDEQLILDAARSFSDMEEVGRTLDGLVQADTATRRFVDVYRKYLAVQAKSDVDQVRTRLDAVTNASTALFAATALRTRRDADRAAAEARAEEADRAYEQAVADRENLQRSSAYEGKQQLDDLADAVRRLETSAAAHRDKAAEAAQTLQRRAEEAEKAAEAVRTAAAALVRGEEALRSAAEEAGIEWTTPGTDGRGDQFTAAVRGHAEERDADVRAVRKAVSKWESAAADRTRAERLAERAVELRDAAAAEVAHAEAAVALARKESAANLRAWWKTNSGVLAGLAESSVNADSPANHRPGVGAIKDADSPHGPGSGADRSTGVTASTAADHSSDETFDANAGRGVRASGAEAVADGENGRRRGDSVQGMIGARSDRTDAGGAGLFAALETAFAGAGVEDIPSAAEVLTERIEPLREQIRTRRQESRARADAAAARRDALTAERKQIAAEHDDAPPSSSARTGMREGLPGAPLWKLVRFGDGVSAQEAAGIEAALQAAGLLDSWICGPTLPAEVESYHFLLPLPLDQRPTGHTLADVLVVEENTAEVEVSRDTVAAVLASIALDGLLPESDSSAPTAATGAHHAGVADGEGMGRTMPGATLSALTAEAGPVVIGTAGHFRLGVLVGRHHKTEAEFIGATARARRRALRLAEIEAAIEAAGAECEAARAEESSAAAQSAELTAAAKSLPRPSAVTAALRAVAETAGLMRSRAEAAVQAERELDQAVAEVAAQDKKVRASAQAHRTPREARELDALAAAIRHFENTGTGLLRLRAEHEREREREREGADRHDEARALAEAFAEEAEAARAGYTEQQRKLETLREALGASAADIDRELDAARAAIEAAKAEQRAARKAANAAIEAVGDAEAAYRTAHEALATALTEVLAEVRSLAPYARPDLLSLLGASVEHRWPSSEAAWSTPEQLQYRIVAAGPETDPVVLPDEVAALFADLDAATAQVRATEAGRKSTRSAVTSALQEFDAALTASGRDYRLHWDAADGLTVVAVHDENGQTALADFAARIDAARRDQELLLTDAERRILEDALLTGLAQQIHERTTDARELISRMGAEMKQRRMSSGNTIGVHWVLADGLSEAARAMCKLLDRDTSALSPDDLGAVRAHFAAEIRAARAAHPERSYPEILAATLDYRSWRVFSFTLISGDGSEDKLTVARHSALSGGEQSVSLHLPLFAAAHVMLDSADPQAPRLLALDEAFAGVDDNGRSELLGLSVQFDLDLFMTGYDLWITYPHVPGCAHYDLAHSTAENTVSATLLVWDSGELLAEHDGGDLTTALGSPNRRRLPNTIEGGLTLEGMPGEPASVG